MALLLHAVHSLGGNISTAMILHFHTYFLSRFPKCLLHGLSLICRCGGDLLLAAMVNQT